MRQSSALADLRDGIECIRHHEKELRLFNVDPSDAIQEELGAFLETQNVRSTIDRMASGKPEDVAVLSNETEVLAVVDVSTRMKLLDHERDKNAFYGVWIDDMSIVDRVLGYLDQTYDSSIEDVVSGA
jgi:hypothetical protein